MRIWIPAVAVALMLAGCAPAAPEATPSSTASAIPTASATPTVTATPNPTPQADPSSALPLLCSDLLSDEEAQAILGSPVTLQPDDTVVSIYTIGSRQAGALECSWAVGASGGASGEGRMILTVLGDADADFTNYMAQRPNEANVYIDGSTTSLYSCSSVHLDVASCQASVLLNGYWTQAFAQVAGQTDESVASGMRSLIDTLTVRIAGAPAQTPAWSIPGGSLTGAYCDHPYDPGPAPAATIVAMARSGLRGACILPSGAEVAILPGGAWGVPLLQGTWAFYGTSHYAPFDISGADLALWGCGNGCRAVVSVGGSAVSIYAPSQLASTVEQLTPLVTTIVAEVTAAG